MQDGFRITGFLERCEGSIICTHAKLENRLVGPQCIDAENGSLNIQSILWRLSSASVFFTCLSLFDRGKPQTD